MKINITLRKIFIESDKTEPKRDDEVNVPQIDISRVKKLTMSKIQQDKKRKVLWFINNYTKAASIIIAAVLITTGSVYAFSNQGVKNFISELTGVQQTKILTVGEVISNKDYELKVHEILTDSYVGDVIISIEALRDQSKENFDSYWINLNHIGAGYSLAELEQYREPYIKYYKISFLGATDENSYNVRKLQFSAQGMRRTIEVTLAPTIERIDNVIAEDNSNGYKYKFDKFHLSEMGITLEGTDTRNMACDAWYNIELLLLDGKREFLQKKIDGDGDETYIPNDVENASSKIKLYENGLTSISQNTDIISEKTIRDIWIDGDLISGSSVRTPGDDDNYVSISMRFSKSLPLNTIKQVIINDIAYDVEK